MHPMFKLHGPNSPYKGKNFEDLYKILRDMVELAETKMTDSAQDSELLQDIFELNYHISELLGMNYCALEMLPANYPEVYEQVRKLEQDMDKLF